MSKSCFCVLVGKFHSSIEALTRTYSVLRDTSLSHVILVGSPNFGHRACEKDLESQITVVTTNEELRRAMAEERDRLFESSNLVEKKTFEEADREIPMWVRFVVKFMRNFF